MQYSKPIHPPTHATTRILSTLIVLLIALLAACAKTDSTPTSTPQRQIPPTASADGSLVIWHALAGTQAQTFDAIIDRFTSLHPGIAIESKAYPADALRDEFITAVDAAGGPDVLIGPSSWIAPLAEHGAIRTINTGLVSTIQNIIPPNTLAAASYAGSLFAVPYSASFPLVYYNTAQINTPPRTFNHLQELGHEFGLLITPDFLVTSTFYLSDENYLARQDGFLALTEPALRQYFTTLQSLAQDASIRFSPDDALFRAGEVNLLIAPAARASDLRSALGETLGIISMANLHAIPTNREEIAIEFSPAMISINATAQAVDAADLFLAYLLDTEAQTIWMEQSGAAPISFRILPENYRSAWTQTLERAIPLDFASSYSTTLGPVLNAALQAVITGETTPEDAVQQIVTLIAP